MQVKLKDIAEKTGYSITTISRALHGYDDVNEQTREKIIAVATEMGYQPNAIAVQLRNQRTNTIGLIISANDHQPSIEDDFFSVLSKGISYGASLYRYDLLISTQSPDDDELDTYRRIVGGNRVDGVLLARIHRSDPRISYLKSINRPFVVAGRTPPDEVSDFPYIDADSQLGIQMMVQHMVDMGHKHIGLILPPDDIAFTPYRHNGYKDGLRSNGIPYRNDYIVIGDLTERGGYDAMQKLFQSETALTAVIACNDLMAVGAIEFLKTRGVEVGREFSVGGFDDLPFAKYVSPALTTIRQPIFEIGKQLTHLLMQIISGEPIESTRRLIRPELVVRESSGPYVQLTK